jgi:hypothetical protein
MPPLVQNKMSAGRASPDTSGGPLASSRLNFLRFYFTVIEPGQGQGISTRHDGLDVFGWVNEIPEQILVGIGANHPVVETLIDQVGKTEHRWMGRDLVVQRVGIEVQDLVGKRRDELLIHVLA